MEEIAVNVMNNTVATVFLRYARLFWLLCRVNMTQINDAYETLCHSEVQTAAAAQYSTMIRTMYGDALWMWRSRPAKHTLKWSAAHQMNVPFN
jgi:hypothetical protein